MDDRRSGGKSPPAATSVPEVVAHWFYRHGLFCAGHPKLVLLTSILGVLSVCRSQLELPVYSGKVETFAQTMGPESDSVFPLAGGFSNAGENENDGFIPHWIHSSDLGPVAYVQQVVMKVMVHPYKKEELIRTDAFRGPIASAFKLHLEDLLAFQAEEMTMDDHCLRTDGLSAPYRSQSPKELLPEFGCLVLSPANLWRRDPVMYQSDPGVVSTVFAHSSGSEAHSSSIAELAFGMRQRDTGLTKYPVRNRQRVISYAVTIALRKYDPKFVKSLRQHLKSLYPLPTATNETGRDHPISSLVHHLFFPFRSAISELMPFFLTLASIFAYVFFSCKKIEQVHSKVGIAFSAILIVIGSIMMALRFSGLTLNMNSKMCIFPYLVSFISLENLMVITRSVVTTPAHLDVKIRVAQGLSMEGWNIMKNFVFEITTLMLVFLLGGQVDSSIRDFCCLSAMGLFADLILQKVFFTSVLSIDMCRTALSDKAKHKRRHSKKHSSILFQHPISGPGMIGRTDGCTTSSVLAPIQQQQHGQKRPHQEEEESKRVKFLNFWARRRLIQRLFSLCMIVWISLFVYQTSLLDTIFKRPSFNPFPVPSSNPSQTTNDTSLAVNISAIFADESLLSPSQPQQEYQMSPPKEQKEQERKTPAVFKRLLHNTVVEPWEKLPYTHWPMLFGLYDISVYGRYVTILPPIHLSLVISPDSAKKLRHPMEEVHVREEQSVSSVEGTKAAFDGTDEEEETVADDASSVEFFGVESPELSPFVPTSPGELLLACIFGICSVFFLLYAVTILYKCVCSRNYAEWRSSWSIAQDQNKDIYTQIVQESVPILVEGHDNEIECLVTCERTNLLASLCLEGTIRTWDAYSGEKLATIDRRRLLLQGAANSPVTAASAAASTTTGARSPPQGDVSPATECNIFPSASFKINTNFATLRSSRFPKENGCPSFLRQDKLAGVSPTSSLLLRSQGEGGIQAVWAMDGCGQYLVLGCARGRVEVWGAISGKLEFVYDDGSGVGVTHVKIVGPKVVLARLVGYIEFFQLEQKPLKERKSSENLDSDETTSRRHHVRCSSVTSNVESFDLFSPSSCPSSSAAAASGDVSLHWLQQVRAHQQPVNCLESGGGRLITGSLDHTLRVFRMEDHLNVFTLHGHSGPITTAFIDHSIASCAGSGSQDGMICVWDLLTGACLYSILGHDGPVLALTYSPSYVISLGADEKICVWERFQGHLINSLSLTVEHQCSDIAMLTHNLLVTCAKDLLVVWDVRLTEPVKFIRVGDQFSAQQVNVMRHMGDSIVCNYGRNLRIVHFPLLSDKKD